MSQADDTTTVARPTHFPCAKCGAELRFKPGTTSLVCPYCAHANEISTEEVETWELDYHAHIARVAEAAPTEGIDILRCESCRAEVQPSAHVTSMACPYCAANLVHVDDETTAIRPTLLLPFQVTGHQAFKAYRGWVTSRWFAPSELKRFARSESDVAGMYVPYWTYDSRTTSDYTGMRGEHYWVTVGSGKNRRRERRTRWWPASGTVQNAFDDLLILASESLPRSYAVKLEPWDIESLVAYARDYLAGFSAERYQIDLEQGFGLAVEKMQPVIRSTIRGDIGGDVQQIHHVNTSYDEITFKHILLPVWMSSYRYRGRVYRFLVNGRTGEVQGERPWSWVKITLAVLGGLAVAGAIAAAVVVANA